MSKYRKVDPRIWNDAKFRSLDDQGKLTFFFLLTHPHMTAIGAMRASIPGLAAEIGWELEAFREAFSKASEKGMVSHDETASLVWLPKFLKYNPPESPNVVKAWVGALDLLPECTLLSRVIVASVEYAKAMNKGFAEALPEAFAKAMPIQEQEQEQEQDKPPASQPGARDPEKFQMHVDWKPSDEFPTLAKMAMVTLPDGKLGEFIAHWLTQPHQRTQAEWDKALLQSIQHDKLRGLSPPRGKPSRERFEEKDYGKGVSKL